MSDIKTNLPQIRAGDQQLQKLLDAVSIVLKTWNGETGNELDRVITYRDLVQDTSIATQYNNANLQGTLTGGIETGGGISVSLPTNLSNLSVVEVITGVIVQWDGGNSGNYSYTEIWRHTSDDLGNATLIGTSVPAIYADIIGDTNTAYYYWIRPVSTGNIAGAFNDTNGTLATTQEVTADDIAVLNLAAINANLGAITAGSLNINNKFIVDSSGNATIRSATTGARVEIYNNVIKVYDAAGVKRVQIGDLSVA